MTFTPTRRAALAGFAAALAAPAAFAQDAELAAKGYAIGDMSIGSADAPLTVTEYSSLTCPHCAAFHVNTWPTIKQRYVDSGKVRFVFREVYFDQYGLWASMISRCGGEGPFFGYVDTFLKRQQEWSRADDVVSEMQRIGRLGGLSPERMQTCLTDETFMRRLVEDYQRNAEADNLRSTPTFIIDGASHSGAMGVEEFSALLDAALAD